MRRFRRTFLATVTVLAVLAAGFAALGYLQGPKLSSAQVDTASVTAKGGQQLRLFANQPVAKIRGGQVHLVPAAPVTVTTAGQAIAITFTDPLRYDTAYRVSITGVTSSDDGRSATLAYDFRTAATAMYYLQRGGAGPDQIVETGIRSVARKVVYSADRIQDFAVFAKAIAVVTLDAQGLSSLSIVATGGVTQQITLPGPGTIDLVRANRDSGLLGFTFTDAGPTTQRRYSDTLFLVDAGGTAVPAPVNGLGGTPLAVLDWSFVPGTSDLIAQGIDQAVVLIDVAKPADIRPLGQFLELGAVSADGRSADVLDAEGPLTLTIAPGPTLGQTTRIVPSAVDGAEPFGGAAVAVPGGWLQQDSVYDTKAARFRDRLVFDDGRSARKLFETPEVTGQIDGFAVSPNEQYVAIETIPDAATDRTDGYAVNPRATSVTTVIVDIATGAVVRSVAGFAVLWG